MAEFRVDEPREMDGATRRTFGKLKEYVDTKDAAAAANAASLYALRTYRVSVSKGIYTNPVSATAIPSYESFLANGFVYTGAVVGDLIEVRASILLQNTGGLVFRGRATMYEGGGNVQSGSDVRMYWANGGTNEYLTVSSVFQFTVTQAGNGTVTLNGGHQGGSGLMWEPTVSVNHYGFR